MNTDLIVVNKLEARNTDVKCMPEAISRNEIKSFRKFPENESGVYTKGGHPNVTLIYMKTKEDTTHKNPQIFVSEDFYDLAKRMDISIPNGAEEVRF